MEGWTEVRYGRRRQRIRQQTGGKDREFGPLGWMDRARSFSYNRRGNQFPSPNQRVPPPRRVQPTGFLPRSYADVVRQAHYRPAWRGPSPGTTGAKKEAAGPQLRRQIRKMHAIIKMVHHLQNVAPKDGKSEPKMIAKMVDVLSNMIKPAAPTQHTMDMITGNARNWGHTSCIILMEHYETKLDDLLEDIGGYLTPDWRSAFEVAVRWARRNLPRITRDAIEHAEAMIAARTEMRDPPQDQTRTGLERSKLQQPGNLDNSRTGHQQGPKTTVATMTEHLDVRMDRTAHKTPSPKQRREKKSAKNRGMVLMEMDEIQELEEEGNEDLEEVGSPPLFFPDLEQEVQRTQIEQQGREIHDMNEQRERSTESPNPRIMEQTIQAQVHQQDNEEEEEIFEQSFDRFVDPGQRKFQVHRHANTTRKMTEWNWEAKKKWIILGDSNLSRLPEFFCEDLQVESFPGANFRHAEALMRKTEPPQDLVVEKVVLSFGINSRGNKPKETTVKNVQAAIRATKARFPYAEVWVPLINFSQTLPAEEKENLLVLNEHIERNMPYIPLLSLEDFQTEDDGIHWTVETGVAMFEHWKSVLNFHAP